MHYGSPPFESIPSTATGPSSRLAVSLEAWTLLVVIVLWVLTAVVSVPVLTLLAQCVAAWMPKPRPQSTDRGERSRGSVIVLIPAHNEESGLAETLGHLSERDRGLMRVLVVADNCEDRTAEVAKAAGADLVIERHDSKRRGKGYALAAGILSLSEQPPDTLIVLDADMSTTTADLLRLAAACSVNQTPCQGISIMAAPWSASPRDQISSFAFSVKNRIRPLGMHNLGLPVLLTGTGMAFPWSLVRRIDFASGHVTEDMELSTRLAREGIFARLVPDAISRGRLPSDRGAARSQRTRWEQGHLQSIAKHCPGLLLDSLIRLSPRRLAFSLDLLVPPLSFLVMLMVVVIAAHALAFAVGLVGSSAALVLLLPTAMATAIILAWARLDEDRPPLSRLLLAPTYVAWKLPFYVAAIFRPERRWVRTGRDSAASGDSKGKPKQDRE